MKKAVITNAEGTNSRASPEAVQKRRVARKLNDLFTGRTERPNVKDGRTEKRRQRLLTELEAGARKGGVELMPLEILQYVQELLDLGETLGNLRKIARVRPMEVSPEHAIVVLREVHQAYQFRIETYRFLGAAHEVLVGAGILSDDTPRRGRPPRSK